MNMQRGLKAVAAELLVHVTIDYRINGLETIKIIWISCAFQFP